MVFVVSTTLVMILLKEEDKSVSSSAQPTGDSTASSCVLLNDDDYTKRHNIDGSDSSSIQPRVPIHRVARGVAEARFSQEIAVDATDARGHEEQEIKLSVKETYLVLLRIIRLQPLHTYVLTLFLLRVSSHF